LIRLNDARTAGALTDEEFATREEAQPLSPDCRELASAQRVEQPKNGSPRKYADARGCHFRRHSSGRSRPAIVRIGVRLERRNRAIIPQSFILAIP